MKTKQTYMKAVFANPNESAKNYGSEKETTAGYKLIDKKTERTIVDCRFYMGRSASASTVYCSLWVHTADGYRSGSGTAGGYGYHKSSAAAASAISAAGIEIYGSPYNRPVSGESEAATKKMLKTRAHISGCGDDSVESALLAIAYAAGCKDCIMVSY